MKATVVKRVSFDAAHFLPNYPGKCANLHGHHWIVEFGVSGDIGEDGMVIDFTELKNFLKAVTDEFDHQLINNVISNPTAENIGIYIRDKFNCWTWSKKIKLGFIRVWETEDSYAEIKSTGEK